ncbi:hypothetical protein D9M68_635370 [compost metagenome]
MVLVEQVQVRTRTVVDEQRLEMLAGDVALEVLVVLQIPWRVRGNVGVDVLRGLLATDAETLHQVVGGQTPLPPGHGFDQSIVQGEIPAHVLNALLAFHRSPICSKSLPVRVNTMDTSHQATYP